MTNRFLTNRLKTLEGRSVGSPCVCLNALGILRGCLAYPSIEEAMNAPRCPVCGRSPLESAAGHPVKLYIGLDTEAV